MPRFARLFEAAADALHAYYAAIAENNLEAALSLWIDEEFVSCVSPNGSHWQGLERIRVGLAQQLLGGTLAIEALDVRAYDSLGTVVYSVAEAHRGGPAVETMVFSTYVMVNDRGEWRIAHIHSSPMPQQAASDFVDKLRKRRGPLH